MALRHVYDDANPFAPELRERRTAAAAEHGRPLAAQDAVEARGRVKTGKPTFERVETRLHGMDVYSRHKQLINNYVLYHAGSTAKLQRDTSGHRNIYDVIRDNHRFLWDDGDDPTKPSTSAGRDELEDAQKTWEAKLAKKYYDKLFKEYCIADLSRYQSNQVAMRWRVEREVFSGKGQFECGSKHCAERQALSSWEVNFAYVEQGERKNALVKLRLCPNCSAKLNFHSTKRLIKKEKKAEKGVDETRRRRRKTTEEDGSGKKRRKRRKHDKDYASSSSSSSEDGDGLEDARTKVKDEPRDAEGSGATAKEKADIAKVAEEAAEIWRRKAAVVDEEKTVEDEFDEFLDDLLL